MAKRFYLILLTIALLISSVYSDDNLLSCDFKQGLCAADETTLFYAHNDFYQPGEPLNILSSNVAVTHSSNYDKSLCCKINNDDLNNDLSTDIENSGNSCLNNGQLLMYFTEETNSRVGFLEAINFDITQYSKQLCIKLPDAFSNFQIKVNDLNFGAIGYTCLYKTNELTNGHVSSCDATFDNGIETVSYNYTVWGKLWENLDSLKCNSDCTSKLDNRVYSACSQKISNCNVPISCDGSLSGAWVPYDANGDGIIDSTETSETQCSAPWSNIRTQVFTNDVLKVETLDDKCINLVKREYSVMYENELITMNIYICED